MQGYQLVVLEQLVIMGHYSPTHTELSTEATPLANLYSEVREKPKLSRSWQLLTILRSFFLKSTVPAPYVSSHCPLNSTLTPRLPNVLWIDPENNLTNQSDVSFVTVVNLAAVSSPEGLGGLGMGLSQ